jgi:HlyD family secretion protein
VATASAAASTEQVGMARASLQNTESDLAKTIIYAPRDGTITRLNSQLGERVVGTAMMAGTDIMTISDLSAMEARVDIGEVDVVLIAPGQKVRLEVDAFKDQKFNGVVTDIANSAKNNDTSSASAAASSSSSDATKFQVKIRLQDKQTFLPGMSVSAEIETRYRTNVLAVPIQCVTLRLLTNSVTTTNLSAASSNKPTAGSSNTIASASTNSSGIDDTQKAEAAKPDNVVFVVEGDHVRAVPVSLGVEDDNYWEITDGLKEGQWVVTGGTKAISKDLQDGTKISTATSATAQTASVK